MNNIIKLLNKEEYLKGIVVEIDKNTTIFHENDECTSICIVIKGEIRISSYTESGRELVFNILGPGMIFGNNLIFSSDNRYKGDVISISKCVFYKLSKNNLMSILQNNSAFLEEYLRLQSDFSKKLNSQLKLVSFPTAKERLDYLFEINNGIISFKSITELAKYMVLSREVLSRLISKEMNERIIYRNGKKIIKK